MPFVYNKFVTGKNFIGRKQDLVIFQNLFFQGENMLICEPPKSGKHSLVQQALFNMRVAGKQFAVAEVSLLNVRTVADLCMRFGSAVIKCVCNTPQEYASAVAEHLAGTHFIFDEQAFDAREQVLSLNWDIDKDDITAVFTLPYRLARAKSTRIIAMIDEFQNVMQTEDGNGVCRALADVFKARTPEDRESAIYILCGSRVNAMKEIFERSYLFARQIERLPLTEIDTKDIIDFTIKGFLNSGKVVERELLLGVCKMFRNNIWYINHFAAICDSLSRGYIMEPILLEALETLISVNEPRFWDIMNDLTTFQVCLLRAIVDGHTKFSSAEVIRRYNLNSSANVRRLKDALCHKEIITFNEEDEPQILDPLFEYWVTRYYFEIKG